eukprot:COSAG01_NODE_6945_length_3429_cov_1.860961_3_plen_53_part_00
MVAAQPGMERVSLVFDLGRVSNVRWRCGTAVSVRSLSGLVRMIDTYLTCAVV